MNVVTSKELTVSNQLNLQLGSYGNMDTDVLVALGERIHVWTFSGIRASVVFLLIFRFSMLGGTFL